MRSKLLIFGMILCSNLIKVMAQESVFNFEGKVVDKAGKGIAGVVVNDGINFTQTNAQGAWSLKSDTTRSKFVSISIPASYNLPQQEGLADGFYIAASTLVQANNKHDFVLEKRKQVSDRFHYIAISDPQVTNAAEMKRWKQETVADLIEVIT